MNRLQRPLPQARSLPGLQITFRGLDPSPALRAQVEAKLRKVMKQFGRVPHCHMVIERPAAEPSKAAVYTASVQLHAEERGGWTVAHAQHANATVAIREAFARLSTQLAARGTRLAYARRTMPMFATG